LAPSRAKASIASAGPSAEPPMPMWISDFHFAEQAFVDRLDQSLHPFVKGLGLDHACRRADAPLGRMFGSAAFGVVDRLASNNWRRFSTVLRCGNPDQNTFRVGEKMRLGPVEPNQPAGKLKIPSVTRQTIRHRKEL
jgi:hypothetical protein